MILEFTPFELACNGIFYAEFCVFLNAVLTPRFRKGWMCLSYVFLVVVTLMATLLFEKMTLMRILTLPVILMGYNLLFFRDKPLRCIFSAWLVPVVIFLSEVLVVALIYNADMLNATLNTAPIQEQVLCWGVEMVSAGVLYWVTSLVLNRVRNRFSIREMLMYTFFPVSQFLLLFGWMNAARELGQSSNHQLMVLAVLLVCLGADAGLFASMIRMSHQIELETENQLLAEQIEAQRAHYADLAAQYENIRSMRHDIAKHISAMDGLLVSGRHEEAAAYVSELRAGSYDKDLGICEHPVVDAYLYSAVHKAKERQVILDAVVVVPCDISIAATDLSVPMVIFLTTLLRPAVVLRGQRYVCVPILLLGASPYPPKIPSDLKANGSAVSGAWNGALAFVCFRTWRKNMTDVSAMPRREAFSARR